MTRSTMANLITKVRSMINDTGGSPIWTDADIQDQLDTTRIDIRYELLAPGPTILNAASTSNQAQVIWCDYYSQFKWWEDDIVLQGNNVSTGASFVVLTPVSSENFFGHWAFENTVFVNGTFPGQYPPVFATGKSYDVYMAAANLLEMWSTKYALAYDFTSDEQQFRRSQISDNQMKLANQYRMRARAVSHYVSRSDLYNGGAIGRNKVIIGNVDRIGDDL